jgi:hypothetical protein
MYATTTGFIYKLDSKGGIFSGGSAKETDFIFTEHQKGGNINLGSVKYIGTARKAIIPERIDGTRVMAINKETFIRNTNITSVVMLEGLQE